MKVFDFDNTIYDGESSFDFFKYCLKRNKSLLKYMPSILHNLSLYKSGRISLDEVYAFCDKMMGVFFENRAYADEMLTDFWRVNRRKLKPEILRLISREDAIISASPEFLLEKIKDKLIAETVICTRTKDAHIEFLCYGKNKIQAFEENFNGKEIDAFYTDSINDFPMMRLAKKAYMVNGNNIKDVTDRVKNSTTRDFRRKQ